MSTKVEHYSKVLHGRKMFYLLLYGILKNDRLRQRTLEDTFNNSGFKQLFHLDETETVVHSSISERLSRIDYRYFQEIYEFIYDKLSREYSLTESVKYNLIRVDSGGAHFVIRAKDNRKYEEIESLITNTTHLDLGPLTLLKDSKVYLYRGKPIQNKRGNLHYREELKEESFRLIEAQSKENPEVNYVFISNDFELTAKEITDFYRKRWDIEAVRRCGIFSLR